MEEIILLWKTVSKFFYFIRKLFYFDIPLETTLFSFSFIFLGNYYYFFMWHANERKFFYFVRKFFYLIRKFFYFIRKFFYFTFLMVIFLSVISFILLGNSFILLGNSFILLLFGFYAFFCDTMGLKTICWWY